MGKESGKVKWFNHRKGYGFIERLKGEDIFVHHTAIQMNGYRILAVGDSVVFDVARGPKGLQAQNVTKGDEGSPIPARIDRAKEALGLITKSL